MKKKILTSSILTKTTFAVLSAVLLFLSAATVFAAKKNKTPNPQVIMETTSGSFTIELFPTQAPITVKNFLQYVDDNFYNGTTFHRIAPAFVLQGGGYTYDFTQKATRDPIINEASSDNKNVMWTLSMARTSNPNSATSQFFINLNDNKNLDKSGSSAGYAVFGKVISGFDVLKKIEREPRGIHRTRPEAPNYAVIIEKAYRHKTGMTENTKTETTKTESSEPPKTTTNNTN